MSIFSIIKFRNIILFILLSFKSVLARVFIEIKKLSPYDSYFVVLDTGLYLYNFNIFKCSIIQEFNNTIYKSKNNKVILQELNYENNSYMICIVNEFLFIFNENNNKTYIYQIKDNDITKDNYCDLLPYKYENNNISFITFYNKNSSFVILNYYNFSLGENINNPKQTVIPYPYIQNNIKRCLIDSYSSSIDFFIMKKLII